MPAFQGTGCKTLLLLETAQLLPDDRHLPGVSVQRCWHRALLSPGLLSGSARSAGGSSFAQFGTWAAETHLAILSLKWRKKKVFEAFLNSVRVVMTWSSFLQQLWPQETWCARSRGFPSAPLASWMAVGCAPATVWLSVSAWPRAC